MPFRVDLDRGKLERAFEASIASLMRQKNTAKNPLFLPIIEADLKAFTDAKNTMTEVK